MKRNALSTAVLAGIAGVVGIASTSNASLYLNPEGTGQVLIYPYYTVNNGNQTLISVVNTTASGKAVKVRFLEGRNSREVLDFNLYLSPFDVWVGAIFGGATGPGRIITPDRSCTVPPIPAAGEPFRNFAYAGTAADGGPAGLDRTREGYVEMIEMGTVVAPFIAPITHGASGVPGNCGAVVAAWAPGGAWDINPNSGIEGPTGGLFGSGAVVQPDEGAMYSFNADAIDAFRETAFHTNPGDLFPSLANVNTSVLPNSSVVFYQGLALTNSWVNGIDAVSSVFMQRAVLNEFILDDVALAATEWVITFPTKRFYVNTNPAVQPFINRFVAPGEACEQITLNLYDREEGRPTGGVDFSPTPPGGFNQLCYEVSTLTFNQADRASAGDPSLLLGSNLYENIEVQNLNGSSYGYQNGWLRVAFNQVGHVLRPSNEGLVFEGLPATGFQASRLTNTGAAAGLLAQYGGLWRHRGERSIFQQTAP